MEKGASMSRQLTVGKTHHRLCSLPHSIHGRRSSHLRSLLSRHKQPQNRVFSNGLRLKNSRRRLRKAEKVEQLRTLKTAKPQKSLTNARTQLNGASRKPCNVNSGHHQEWKNSRSAKNAETSNRSESTNAPPPLKQPRTEYCELPKTAAQFMVSGGG